MALKTKMRAQALATRFPTLCLMKAKRGPGRNQKNAGEKTRNMLGQSLRKTTLVLYALDQPSICLLVAVCR